MSEAISERSWPRRRLKFVANLVAGQSADGSAVNDSGDGLPFLQGCAEFGEKSPTADRYCVDPPKIAPLGSWMVSVRAPVGRTNKADQVYGIGRGLAAVEAVKIDAGFLGYVLEDGSSELNSLATGSTFLAVSAPQLGSLVVPLPPPETQKRIAAFLDEKTAQIDALITRKQTLLERLAEKRQAIITQAVTKGLNPAAAMKDSGIDWLGEVPAHWEVKRLSFISQVIDCKHRTPEYIDDGIPMVSTTEISPYRIDYQTKRRVSEDELAVMSEGGRRNCSRGWPRWVARGVGI